MFVPVGVSFSSCVRACLCACVVCVFVCCVCFVVSVCVVGLSAIE